MCQKLINFRNDLVLPETKAWKVVMSTRLNLDGLLLGPYFDTYFDDTGWAIPAQPAYELDVSNQDYDTKYSSFGYHSFKTEEGARSYAIPMNAKVIPVIVKGKAFEFVLQLRKSEFYEYISYEGWVTETFKMLKE